MKIKKSKKANLENKRVVFFQIGLIISLALVFTAFEWKVGNKNTDAWIDYARAEIPEELVDVTVHEKKEPEMPKPQITPIFVEVDNDDIIDDEPDFSSEVTKETENALDFMLEEPDDEPEELGIFTIVEEQPSFPGGIKALYKYLADNIEYPKVAKEAGITGPVYVEFVVWKDGSIRMTNVIRGIGGGCDEETLRVLSNMPRWNPGLQRSVPVNVKMSIPVLFKLKN